MIVIKNGTTEISGSPLEIVCDMIGFHVSILKDSKIEKYNQAALKMLEQGCKSYPDLLDMAVKIEKDMRKD